MSVLTGLGLDDRRKILSQAAMESHGKEPSDDLLRELREALDKDNKDAAERRQAEDKRREEDRQRMMTPGQPK